MAKPQEEVLKYDYIKIGLASPETIRSWSYGEVLRPETINYRTLRPEKDGLFCERIFGTTKDYECFCGKFKSIRYKGVVCDRCGVEVTHSKVRRERMGHIELSCPVAHIWFYKAVPSRIGLLLDMSIITLKSVIFYEKYIVTHPGDVPELKKYQLLTEEEYYDHLEQYGDGFRAGIGAEVIRDLLSGLDLESEAEALRTRMSNSRVVDKRKLIRLSLLEDFIKSANRPEHLIMDVIPVIPPELRPMVQLEGGRFATSDLNDLYRRLINRNNRLKKLIALKAPDIIVKNEKRMLQEAVDALFDNARRKRAVKGAGNRPLKSLSDVLKGKQGRFRQNLLGKRVDYSGRSVIVVGPELKIHQCGLPRKMAIELFKPFIMKKLVDKKLVFNIKSAKKVIDNEFPEVWRILEEVVKSHPVLLNRAPTLHRLGIQAFEPVLTDDKAIRLHPLVCTAYNADFDGDQMAVHVPLSSDAQIEAWTLMLASKNLLDPANGNPIVNPTQDMILGTYNLTSIKKGVLGEGKLFPSEEQAKKAYFANFIHPQASIKVRNDNGEYEESTVGRIIFSETLPDDYPRVSKVLDDKALKALIADVHTRYGNYATTIMLDKIKATGFHYSMLFGNTINISDILIPEGKKEIVEKAQEEVVSIEEQYRNGIITTDERYQKIISIWTFANDKLTKEMMDNLSSDDDGHNPLFIMATSGARGSKQQIRQLAGMRGLMAKPSGEIIEMPIVSNFKEGLTVLEYFISTHGARKGLSDTALKTADAGYLTRKLVDIAQDVTIELDDCGTISGINIYPIKSGDEVIEKLSERVVGRYTAEPIVNPYTDEILLPSDESITPEIAQKIDDLEVEKVRIRTVVTCDAPRGICKKCYGINLATGRAVDIGEAVGILASQSIGQPGTQLTMRTFHIGGTASSEVRDPEFKRSSDSVLLNLPANLVRNRDNKLIASRRGFMTMATVFQHEKLSAMKTVDVKQGARLKIGDLIGITQKGKELKAEKVSFVYINKEADNIMVIGGDYQEAIEVGAIFEKEVGEFIKKNQVVYTFDPINEPIIAETNGKVGYVDIVSGKTLKEELDEMIGTVNRKIIDSKEENIQPKLVIVPDKGESVEADLPTGAILTTEEGITVHQGDILARQVRAAQKTADITGGLPRVQELFEARNPSNIATIADIDGTVEIGGTAKGKRAIYVKNEYGHNVKHVVPAGKALLVRNLDVVKAGEPLCEGLINPHDILKVRGEISLYEYVLENVQEVYKRQGVNINDKHIGVIIRQMLRKVEIVDPGDTPYIKGELIDKYRLREENKSVAEEGGQPAVAQNLLLGLTKASLNTESFISSASFQETTKVLSNAAIKNSKDELRGLKENVIIGHEIPAGTGKDFYSNVKVYKNVLGDLDFIGSESDSDTENVEPVKEEESVEA